MDPGQFRSRLSTSSRGRTWRRFGQWGILLVLSSTIAPLSAQAADPELTRASPRSTTPNTSTLPRGEEWPQFRGPRGDGTWKGPNLPRQWPAAGLKLRWKQAIGGGYSGVVVSQGRVIVSDRQTKPTEVERVLCYSSATGDLLWKHEYPVTYGKLDYGNGPRAAATIEADRVYTTGALGRVDCLNLENGRPIWTLDLQKDLAGRLPTWGFAASPFIYGDLLILQPGGKDGQSVVAVDKRTGKKVWNSLSDNAGYSTPMVVEQGEARHLIVWTPTHLRSLHPATGKPQWELPYEITYGEAIAAPIVYEGIVVICGYWTGSRGMRLAKQGSGATLLWSENRYLRGLMSQPLCKNGYCYLLDKQYGLTCFDVRTGKKLWDDKNKMTPRGRNPQASLVWLGEEDRVIILNEKGELILARLTPQGYAEDSRTKIIGETWAHPAYTQDAVFARSDSEIVCYELPTLAKP